SARPSSIPPLQPWLDRSSYGRRQKERTESFPCATTFSGERVNLAPPLSKLLGPMSYGKPTIAQARHPPQSVLIVAGRNPNWNRLLNRFGLNAKLFELKVLSCKCKSTFGPQATD